MIHYRKDVDGLRAIAVLPVILFHAGFVGFQGGFVGVDIFFVISGYLITSIIQSEIQAGNFSFTGFYERRARRLLPALFLVIFCCLPFAWLWMPPADVVNFSKSLVTVSLFVSNVFFWRDSGYFALANEFKPLLHTWSLAVEEQYYVLFPLFFVLAWKLKKKGLVSILVVFALASFGAAHWGSIHKPTAAFFLLPTRVWELLLGALAAIYLAGKPPANDGAGWKFQVASLSGLALVVFAVVAFDKNTRFPGAYALVPTLGAMLIILFSGPANLVGKLLSCRPLVGVGLISYSAYLWHQPLFAFARLRTLEQPASELVALLALASFLLAYLSWRFVEGYFRDRQKVGRYGVFALAIIATLTTCGVGVVGMKSDGFEARFKLPADVAKTLTNKNQSGACIDRPKTLTREDWLCDIGLKTEPVSFFLAGDSHSLAMLPAFEEVSQSQKIHGLTVAASGCPPLLGIYTVPGDNPDEACHGLNQRVFEYVKKNHIAKLVLVSRWTYYTDGGYDGMNFSHISLSKVGEPTAESSRRAFEAGIKNTLDEYGKIGVRVVVVFQVPQQAFNATDAYYKVFKSGATDPAQAVSSLSISVPRHLELQRYVRDAFNKYRNDPRLAIVNLDKAYCNDAKCLMGDEQQSYYFDAGHVSTVGAKKAVPALLSILKQ